MSRFARLRTLVLFWLSAFASLGAQAGAPLPPVTVHQEVSRTAVWVGDPIVYTVEVICQPGIEILAADLARDRVQVKGLELGDAVIERQVRTDGSVVHRARFRLVSYSTDTTLLRVEPMRVRYYVPRRGERIENLTPAGEVEIPAVEIALRSTLPDGDPSGIRDSRAPALLPPWVRFLRPLGAIAVALSIAPALVGLGAVVARRRQARFERQSKRRSPEQNRAELDRIQNLAGTSDKAARREAFDRLDRFIREYVTDLGVDARSLTPDEIDARVTETLRLRGDVIASVLRDCQRASYGGLEQLPDGDALNVALRRVEEVLAAGPEIRP